MAFSTTNGKAQATINSTTPKPSLGLLLSKIPEIISINPKNPKIMGNI